MIPAAIWLLTVQVLGIVALPLTVRAFAGLPDRGYGLTRVVGVVVVGWLAYLTAMLGFTAYVGATVAILGALVGGALWARWWQPTLLALRERWRLLAAEEAAFLVIFALGTLVRAYNVDIIGQEKFMDFAFLNALLRTTSLPADDMWLAGHAMPYYYLGYFLVGLPAKIAGTPGPMAYSLAMVWVFAAGFGAAVSIAYALVAAAERATATGTRFSVSAYVFGLLAGTLTMVVGNLVGPFELLAARGWGSPDFWATVGVKGLLPADSPSWLPVEGGWWWRSSRVIANIKPDGITEFPYFSFLLGDLHPHYMVIPFVLLVVGLAASRWLDRESLPDLSFLLVGALALATLVPTSTWDVPTFWGLFVLAVLGDAWRRGPSRRPFVARLPALAIPLVLAVLLVVPYFVGYQSQPLSLERVAERTPLVSMLILFGPTLLVSLVFALWLLAHPTALESDPLAQIGRLAIALGLLLIGLSAFGQSTIAVLIAVLIAAVTAIWPHLARPRAENGPRPAAVLCGLLVVWALCVLVGTEIIFLRDVFGSRMNTVFKFHYHAWLLLGVASGAGLGLIWRSRPARVAWRMVAVVIATIILLPGLVYPLGATWTKSNAFRGEPTLMGDRFLERSAPSDYRAIEWLRANAVGRPVVVEAVGGSYTEHARVSTFSGLPTILGWAGHEAQWRGERPEYGARQQAIDIIYRTDSRDEIERLARQYKVRYVFFGNLERAKYGSESQARLDRLLAVAYTRSGTTIYMVEPE